MICMEKNCRNFVTSEVGNCNKYGDDNDTCDKIGPNPMKVVPASEPATGEPLKANKPVVKKVKPSVISKIVKKVTKKKK